ncbi:MAG: hypothetical protein B6242_13015 [Anaerolineaceae bacterium 4572_78]|nr:MAG: hypothetical protein B6242_13015 [Anaerolineaceae bacterium 4572_78]
MKYIFKHVLMRDAAYHVQMPRYLKDYHWRAAEAIETLHADNLSAYYGNLAYHYEQASIIDKAIEYLQKAGNYAQSNYQNQQALDFYDKLLKNLNEFQHDPDLEIDTLLKKGAVLSTTGQLVAGQNTLEQALHLAEKFNNLHSMGEAYTALGELFWRTCNYDQAMTCYQHARPLFVDMEDRKSFVDMRMGIVHFYQANYDEAMVKFENHLHVCESLGNKKEVSMALNNIASVNSAKGDYDLAVTNYEKALAVTRDINDKQGIATIMGNLGAHYQDKGDYDIAITYLDQAIAIHQKVGYVYGLTYWFLSKANCLLDKVQLSEAKELVNECIRLSKECSMSSNLSSGQILSAKIDFAMGQEDTAIQFLQDMLTETNDEIKNALLYYELWHMTKDEYHRQASLEWFDKAKISPINKKYDKHLIKLRGIVLPSPS